MIMVSRWTVGLILAASLLALLITTAAARTHANPMTPIRGSLRSDSTTMTTTTVSSTPTPVRTPLVQRLYGEGNALVRKHVSELETRLPRYQTGLPGDHRVDYIDHPYDDITENGRRRTQTSSNSTFQPLRIVFETKALDDMRDETNAAKIDWYKNVILPYTAAFWSQTLSVVPVSGPLRISTNELDSFSYCGDPEFTEVPNEHKSSGVDNADLILYVSGSSSTRFCPARTLAVAVPCNFDQFDRPTAGAINVCLDNIELYADGTASPDVVQDYNDVTIHEVGHVLGLSSNSYRFYWDPETGEPRTSRPFQERTVTCVNGVQRTLVLPDANTMEFGADSQGKRYAAIVTPKVQTVARNQFDCQELAGAQLENQPTRSESCTGDHWDERLYYPEAMSGVISPTANILSSLTLALMEDTGWYRANYTNSEMSPWGLGAGCNFVDQPCLVQDSAGDTVVPDYGRGFFCKEGSDKGCSAALTHKMSCSIFDYNYYSPVDLPGEQYQYFPNEPSRGGPRQADFCPVYGTTYDNYLSNSLACSNAANAPSLNVYSETYGEDSKCIESTAGEGLCYKTACVKEDMSLRINILGEWIKCESDFESHTISVGQGLVRTTIFCPRLSQACPDLFCPFNCAGRGTCDYTNVVNGTSRPVCVCFDPEDTSEACSDSLVPDGAFLMDSSGLFDNLEENFFDPLIKVFVDHPDAWTTASWAWAAGLIAIFFILLLCICSSVCPQRPRKR